MKRILDALDRAPLYWVSVALGLVVFGLNLPMAGVTHPETEQALLDRAFIESIRAQPGAYELVPGAPQTFGAHVLPQYLRALVSLATGDIDRAGIWLSLAGVVSTIAGLYVLAIRIYPLRGFAVAAVVVAGALGSLHVAVSSDPSVALGMALVVWGMALFLTAVTESAPHDVFGSGLLFGLAGYVRLELSLIWLFLALYLVVLEFAHAKARRDETSALSMALGGLLTVLVVLWPMMHRNMGLAGTPMLPGYDAELILGAPVEVGGRVATRFVDRMAAGVGQLTLGALGPGVFAGLLWPAGMGLCLFLGRHKRIPYFWIPVLVGTLAAMTAVAAVTGAESYHQTLLILTPMVFPFALLPVAYVAERWMQRGCRSLENGRLVWTGVAAVFLVLVQIPSLLRPPGARDPEQERSARLLEDLGRLTPRLRSMNMVSDLPGPMVGAGKTNVIGTRGQTDWSILATATAHGGFQEEAFLAYLRDRDVGVIHLSNPQDPLVDKLKRVEGAPRFHQLNQIRPPHRMFRISWREGR